MERHWVKWKWDKVREGSEEIRRRSGMIIGRGGRRIGGGDGSLSLSDL